MAQEQPPLRPPWGSLALQALGAPRVRVQPAPAQIRPVPASTRAETRKSRGSFFQKGCWESAEASAGGAAPRVTVLCLRGARRYRERPSPPVDTGLPLPQGCWLGIASEFSADEAHGSFLLCVEVRGVPAWGAAARWGSGLTVGCSDGPSPSRGHYDSGRVRV